VLQNDFEKTDVQEIEPVGAWGRSFSGVCVKNVRLQIDYLPPLVYHVYMNSPQVVDLPMIRDRSIPEGLLVFQEVFQQK
jgi:hypothetical protein